MFKQIQVNNIYQALERGRRDEAVKIKIVELAGDENFTLYAAEIEGYQRVGSHYHTKGLEIYQIVEGRGKMYLGTPLGEGKVEWGPSVEVQPGDCFTVSENEAHQLVNIGEERLIILFICPPSHLGSDRILVNGVAQ